MKIYDISVPIRPGMPHWPGDPPIKLEKIASIQAGDSANITQIQMCVHTGTHIDAPHHFLAQGKTVDQLAVESFYGEVLVMAFPDNLDVITGQALAAHTEVSRLKKASRVLFKTRNSKLWKAHPETFQENYVGLDASGARFLSELDLSLIGLDYLSVAAFHDTHQPHQILLSREIILLEGIDLSRVEPGHYHLLCAPLLIEGCEGAPARVFLLA